MQKKLKKKGGMVLTFQDPPKNKVEVEVSPLQYHIAMTRTVDGVPSRNYLLVTPDEAQVLLTELERAVKFSNRT